MTAPLTVINALSLELVCGYCRAPRGSWCVVAKGRTAGRRSAFLHAGRTWLPRLAWYAGVREGMVWGLDQVARDLDPDNRYGAVHCGQVANLGALFRALTTQLERQRDWHQRALREIEHVTGRDIERT